MFVFQLCATKISLTCRSLGDHHKGNVHIVPTAFSFGILPGPIFGSLPNLTSAFIPEITSLHTFTSSTITVEGKCQYLHPVKNCVSIKSWQDVRVYARREEWGTIPVLSLNFRVWVIVTLGPSAPLLHQQDQSHWVQKENIPNDKRSLLWELKQHPAGPLHLCWDAGWFLSLLSQGHTNPWKKKLSF